MKSQKIYHVYILKCADGTFYTGIAIDVEKRKLAHNAGKGAKYTRARRPVKLLYSEKGGTRAEAMRREIAIKKMGRPQKLRLIRESRGKK